MLPRRIRASALLAVLFTSISLGICAPVFAGDGMPPCCTSGSDSASLTVCCRTGDEASSELPAARALPAPFVAIAFLLTRPVTAPLHAAVTSRPAVAYGSADAQALLSIFLI